MRAEDSRQLRWLFLMPDRELKETELASCLELKSEVTPKQPDLDVRIWDDVLLTPASFESEFCILPNDEQRRQPILEGLAVEVLEATEGIAQEEVGVQGSQRGAGCLNLFMFPAIVTNAEIMACRFNSRDVNIKEGTLDPSNAEMFPVPFIRFRKSLTSDFPPGRFRDLQDVQRARERTIFVVNAASMSVSLTDWDLRWRTAEGSAVSRYLRPNAG